MVNGLAGLDTDGRTCSDRGCGCTESGVCRVVAPEIRAGHISNLSFLLYKSRTEEAVDKNSQGRCSGSC